MGNLAVAINFQKVMKYQKLTKNDCLELESNIQGEDGVEPENMSCFDDDSHSLVNEDDHAGSRAGSIKDKTNFSDLNSALADWAVELDNYSCNSSDLPTSGLSLDLSTIIVYSYGCATGVT